MEKEFNEDEAKRALDDLLDLLDRIPGAAKFRKDVQRLKALLVDRRAPRLVVVGRRGHGKSSIANALLGYPKLAVGHVGDQPADEEWLPLEVNGRHLHWLDTSGIGAGGIVGERLDKLKAQVKGAFPDVILLAVKASEVDSEIDATLGGFNSILNVLRAEGCSAPVIVLVTKVDELHPARDKEPPYRKPKQELIEAAVKTLAKHLERHSIKVKATLPLSAYMEFTEPEKAIEFDGRWNVDRLGDVVFSCLPEEATVEAARAFQSTKELRRKVARQIVAACAAVAFGVGLTPIPISDLAILAPLQLLMVTAVSYLSGRRIGARAIADWLASLGVAGGAGIGLRAAFQQLVKLLPVGGPVLSAALAGAGTWAIGMSAIAYFIDDKSLDEAKAVFSTASKASRDWRPEDVE
ncbi:MAG: GTPase family protein [Myxococcota bacterium]